MLDFIAAIFSPINLALAALLGLCLLYWVVVIVFGLAAEALDAVLGLLDFGVDADADFDTSGGGKFGLGLVGSRLLNLGRVPVAVTATVLIFVVWAVNLLSYPLQREWGYGWRLLALVPIFVLALPVTKVLTWPVAKLFDHVRESDRPLKLVGQTCRITSFAAGDGRGQAQVATAGSPLLLNVRSTPGSALSHGDEAVIVEHDAAQGVYVVRSTKE